MSEGLDDGFEHYIPIEGDQHAVAIGSGLNTRAKCRRIAEYGKPVSCTLRQDNVRTPDLGGSASTAEFARAIIARLR